MPKTATGKVQRRLVAEAMTGKEQTGAKTGSLPSKSRSPALAAGIEITEKRGPRDVVKPVRGGLRLRIARLLGK